MENSNYKNKNLETKYLNNIPKYRLLKVNNSILEFEKDLIELKYRELKDMEVKIKTARKIIFKPILVSIDDVDKFEQKQLKKRRTIKNNWHDWLINCICELISSCGFTKL